MQELEHLDVSLDAVLLSFHDLSTTALHPASFPIPFPSSPLSTLYKLCCTLQQQQQQQYLDTELRLASTSGIYKQERKRSHAAVIADHFCSCVNECVCVCVYVEH